MGASISILLSCLLNGNLTLFLENWLIIKYEISKKKEKKQKKKLVITPSNFLEFISIHFGLKNATFIFKCFMGKIVFKINYVFVYLDDVLVYNV